MRKALGSGFKHGDQARIVDRALKGRRVEREDIAAICAGKHLDIVLFKRADQRKLPGRKQIFGLVYAQTHAPLQNRDQLIAQMKMPMREIHAV